MLTHGGVATLILVAMNIATFPGRAVSLNFTSAGRGNPSIFGDYMVLQQAPAKAVIYGMLNASDTSRAVSVTVSSASSESDGGPAEASYTVQATVTGDHWKALLHPTTKGGDYSVTVAAGTNTLHLQHVTFGDVFYCSGQYATASVLFSHPPVTLSGKSCMTCRPLTPALLGTGRTWPCPLATRWGATRVWMQSALAS